MPPYGWTASKASLDRVENPALSLAIASRRPGMSAAVLIARHVGLLHDAEEGASRVLKHNEVVFSTIPPGISSCSQNDQSLNFGSPLRGVEVEMKPTPAAGRLSRPWNERLGPLSSGSRRTTQPSFAGSRGTYEIGAAAMLDRVLRMLRRKYPNG